MPRRGRFDRDGWRPAEPSRKERRARHQHPRDPQLRGHRCRRWPLRRGRRILRRTRRGHRPDALRHHHRLALPAERRRARAAEAPRRRHPHGVHRRSRRRGLRAAVDPAVPRHRAARGRAARAAVLHHPLQELVALALLRRGGRVGPRAGGRHVHRPRRRTLRAVVLGALPRALRAQPGRASPGSAASSPRRSVGRASHAASPEQPGTEREERMPRGIRSSRDQRCVAVVQVTRSGSPARGLRRSRSRPRRGRRCPSAR